MQELNQKIVDWAKERGIDKNGTVEGQVLKTVEEMSELIKGICKDDIDLIKDSIGDVYVTLVIGNMLSQKSIDIYETVMEKKKQRKNLGLKALKNKHEEKIRLLSGVSDGIDYILIYQSYERTAIDGIVYWLLSIVHTYDTTLKECVELAYNEIKNRKGKVVDGVFVKEGDLK
mgnify:CR=1 FL=1